MIFSLFTSETTRMELQPAAQLWLAAGPSNGSYHSLRGFCNTQHIFGQSTRRVSQFSSDKKACCCVAVKNKERVLKEEKAEEQRTPLSFTAAFLNWPSLFPGFSDSLRPQTEERPAGTYGTARCPFFKTVGCCCRQADLQEKVTWQQSFRQSSQVFDDGLKPRSWKWISACVGS